MEAGRRPRVSLEPLAWVLWRSRSRLPAAPGVAPKRHWHLLGVVVERDVHVLEVAVLGEELLQVLIPAHTQAHRI
jgi:hypothetical protein